MAKRFDHVYRDFEGDGLAMASHANSSVKAYRLARYSAFRMAKGYVLLQREHHNQLLDLVKGQGFKGIDEWLDKWLDPFVEIGGEVRALVNAVNEGMSMKEFMAGSPRLWLSKRAKPETANSGRVQTPPPAAGPPEDASPADQAAYWRERCLVLEVELKQAKAETNDQKRRILLLEDQLKKEMKRISKLMAVA